MGIRKQISAAVLVPVMALLAVFAFNLTATRADVPPAFHTVYLPVVTKDVGQPPGHFGGRATALALEGTTLYAAIGPTLQVFDVSTPTQFTLLGAAPLADTASAILIRGGYAYVAARYAGLQVIDITTPAAPRTVARLDLAGRAQALAVKGSTVYVSGEKAGLHIVDIATPSAPRRVETLANFPGLTQLAVVGSYLYVAPFSLDNDPGIGILDLATPTQPVQIGRIRGWWNALAAAGPNLLAVGGYAPLTLLDVTTPLAPRALASCDDYACSHVDALYASGQRLAMVSHSGFSISIYDISDPTKLTPQGGYSQRDASVDAVALGNGYVYAAGNLGLGDAAGLLALKLGQGELLAAGDFPDSALASPINGYGYKFQADAAHLYLLAPASALSSTLRVFDTANPADPREIASRTIPAANPRDVALDGSRLYLALDELRVVDVANPAAPLVGGAYRGQHVIKDVSVVNHLVAALDSGGGGDDMVRLVDASDMAAPHEVGSYAAQGQVTAMAGAGATLYLAVQPAFSSPVLRILDVSTPASPHELGSYALPGKAQALGVGGSRVYVYVTGETETSTGSLLILGVTNPADVRLLGTQPMRGVSQIQAVGNTVYLNPIEDYAFQDGRWLEVLDVATPSASRLVGFVAALTLDQFQVVGTVAYANMGMDFDANTGKLRTLNLANPGAPQVFGFLATPSAFDTVVQGNLAYVAVGDSGIQTLDVSNPLRPRWQSSTMTVDGAAYISPGAGRVLCIGGSYYLSVYEMLPAGRLALRNYNGGTDPQGRVLCDGTRLYLADDFGEIPIFDITDPEHLRWLGSVDIGHGNEPFAVQGNTLYVLTWSKFRIYDVTDPAHAQRLAEITLNQGDTELDVVGHYAYITDYDVGLRIIDVSDPRAPHEVATLPLPGAWPIRVSGGYAYVGMRPVWQAASGSYTRARLSVVDVSNPLAPRLASEYPAPDGLSAITVAGDYVYAAAGSAGLYVFPAR